MDWLRSKFSGFWGSSEEPVEAAPEPLPGTAPELAGGRKRRKSKKTRRGRKGSKRDRTGRRPTRL